MLLEYNDSDLVDLAEYEGLSDDELEMFGFDFDLDREENELGEGFSLSEVDSSYDTNSSTNSYIMNGEESGKSNTKKRRRKEELPTGPKQKCVRRKPLKNVLYAFPPFDKCDSLLYLPISMTRYLNNADFPKLARLLNSHLDKNCEIVINPKFPVCNAQMLIKIYELMDELQPDRIMCVHSTKVVENQICATIYKKFTACKTIFNSVARTSRKTDCPVLCDIRSAMKCPQKHPSPVKTDELHRLLLAEENVTVYSRADLVITFDDVTKKVVQLRCTPMLTSMHANNIDYRYPENHIASSCVSMLGLEPSTGR
jgi:hypothetical protein